jgi:type I restriction enzyme, S subunit
MHAELQAQKTGIAIPGISREDIIERLTPLPPLAEQSRIVAKVDELMSLCDPIEQKLGAAQVTSRGFADALVGAL